MLLISLFLSILSGLEAQNVFWRYTKDRYNKATLADPISVPEGLDPYEYFAGEQGFSGWMVRSDGAASVLSEKSVEGVVPVLCLHKIGNEEEYALSPDRFTELLLYLNDRNWYLISDSQYLKGDFSRVPTGMKPIVMGSDDAPAGTFIYQTKGDLQTGSIRRIFGEPILDRNSMVAILERYAPREDGRINFTFYISFDAIPFRQLGGKNNPGFPYEDVPVIYEKVQYLDRHFILGIHTLSHIYAHDMSVEAFAQDVMDGWTLIDRYAGGTAESLETMAFPYGIRPLTPELRNAMVALERDGKHLVGGFDLDNRLAPPPGAPGDNFDVSRFNVDNKNWDRLIRTLDGADAVVARRMIIWETDSKRLPRSRYALGATSDDDVWVLVKADDQS